MIIGLSRWRCIGLQPFLFELAMFTVVYAESVADDLATVRALDRKLIFDQIEQQLPHQPTQETL
jgi:hypothetical protein